MRLLTSILILHGALSAASSPSPAMIRASDDFSRVAEQANPWVVNISSTQLVRQRVRTFWDEFYGMQPLGNAPTRTLKRQSLGSGFLYSADGLILTNAHVVQGADEIMVRLMDGTEAQAKVIGEDANVDLALLKIETTKRLPVAPLGDSSAVKVGQWAIAIGNPFGFDHSLTVGVISAKERVNIFQGQGSSKYQNYLQTDASINHGNSGGPLCNIRGQVIGMNTAISTPNEGSIGIGFAIPINFIKRSVPDLLRAGKVVAPKLGFYTQDVDERLAKSLKLPKVSGVLISDVMAGGPADKSGLKRNDVVREINGKSVANTAELRTRIYDADPNTAMSVGVWRQGDQVSLQVAPELLKGAEKTELWHGLKVSANNAEQAAKRGLAVTEGLVVDQVALGSTADRIGIKAGDVLIEMNQARLNNLSDWDKLTSKLDESKDAVLLLFRGQQSAYVVLPGEEN